MSISIGAYGFGIGSSAGWATKPYDQRQDTSGVFGYKMPWGFGCSAGMRPDMSTDLSDIEGDIGVGPLWQAGCLTFEVPAPRSELMRYLNLAFSSKWGVTRPLAVRYILKETSQGFNLSWVRGAGP